MRAERPLKIALITFVPPGQPRSGEELRNAQLVRLTERIAAGRVMTWDLHRGGPAGQKVTSNANETGSRDSWLTAARDFLALALHIWPGFTVSLLGAQKARILSWLSAERPTHAIVTHPAATELVPYLRALGARVFVDAQNVQSDLGRQLVSLSRTPAEWAHAAVYWRAMLRREQREFRHVDEVWLPSVADAKLQLHLSGDALHVRVVPNALEMRDYTTDDSVRTHDLVFPASFDYPPNLAAAELLVTRILPAVRASIKDARLLLVGRDPRGWAKSLARDEYVTATGEVPDVQPYLRRAGVVAVPILQGGGTRFKILEALATGAPVVTTHVGCEGLDVIDGVHLRIQEVDQFPEAISDLLNDPRRGLSMGMAGRQLVECNYSWDAVELELREALGLARSAEVG